MLKPVVNMNAMAMNESIATTCCYVWNGTSVAGSASLPHGGKLVGSNSYEYYLKENRKPISKGWINWKGGHITAAGYNALNKLAPFESAGKWYINLDNTVHVLLPMDCEHLDDEVDFVYCDHNSIGCKYEKVVSSTTMKHTGATSAHYTWTSGNSWLQDHTAYQYSS